MNEELRDAVFRGYGDVVWVGVFLTENKDGSSPLRTKIWTLRAVKPGNGAGYGDIFQSTGQN